MKRDKPTPDPTPEAFHDLLDKAATTVAPTSPPAPKDKPESSSVLRLKPHFCGEISARLKPGLPEELVRRCFSSGPWALVNNRRHR